MSRQDSQGIEYEPNYSPSSRVPSKRIPKNIMVKLLGDEFARQYSPLSKHQENTDETKVLLSITVDTIDEGTICFR